MDRNDENYIGINNDDDDDYSIPNWIVCALFCFFYIPSNWIFLLLSRSISHYFLLTCTSIGQKRCHIHSKHVSYARQISIALSLPLYRSAFLVNVPFFSLYFALNLSYEPGFYIVYVMLSMYNCQQPNYTRGDRHVFLTRGHRIHCLALCLYWFVMWIASVAVLCVILSVRSPIRSLSPCAMHTLLRRPTHHSLTLYLSWQQAQ